ncbi:MAG: sigma-54-dependent transcriptional regulator [Nitrospiria bacterium]
MIRMFIVDDNEKIRHSLASFFYEKGYEVIECSSGEEALERLQENEADLVISDFQMGGMSGLDLLRKIKEKAPLTQVMIITAFGTVERAVEAMRQGAFDYLLKPFSLVEMETKVEKALEQRRLLTENRYYRETIQNNMGRIIGQSSGMQQVYRLIEKIAPTATPVLILGETGTGKELVAKEIHNKSPRAERPFIAINCGAIPENLIEAELFGYEKGAFTGAATSKKGRFEMADGGTLFLDEIGELPLHLQVKLLRFIQEQELERVGGTKIIKVDSRLIAATHRDLKKEVQEKRFREDLFYRIRVIEICLPALRERGDDIKELSMHFLMKINQELHKNVQFPPEIIDLFSAYPWPGNVRELENIVERAVVLADSNTIQLEDLPSELHSIPAPEKPSPQTGPQSMTERIEEMEREIIRKTMEEVEGNQTKAAKTLGLHRSSLQYKLRKYGLLG